MKFVGVFGLEFFLIGPPPPQTASHQLTRLPVVEVIQSLVVVSSSDQLQSYLLQEIKQLLQQELPYSQLFLLQEGAIYFATLPQPLQ